LVTLTPLCIDDDILASCSIMSDEFIQVGGGGLGNLKNIV